MNPTPFVNNMSMGHFALLFIRHYFYNIITIFWSERIPNSCGHVHTFVQARSTFPHHSGEESERLQVFQDVAVLSGDQDHVELLQWLVDVANAIRLHEGVLLPGVHQFGECSQKTLNTSPGHLHKLPGHDGFPGLGAHRRGQQHLHHTGMSSPLYTTLHQTPASSSLFQLRNNYFVMGDELTRNCRDRLASLI